MSIATAPEIQHVEDSTPGLRLVAGPPPEPADATQGTQLGSRAYDDATQGRQVGAGSYDDATRARR